MRVALRDARPDPADGRWLGNVLPFYLRDLSAHGGAFRSLDDEGLWQPAQRVLADFLTRPDTDALLILDDAGRRVGFALVAHRPFPRMAAGVDHHLAEFFILGAYRGRGLGRAAAHAVFARWSGRWDMFVLTENAPAQRFWRRLLAHAEGLGIEPDGNADRFLFDAPLGAGEAAGRTSDGRPPAP